MYKLDHAGLVEDVGVWEMGGLGGWWLWGGLLYELLWGEVRLWYGVIVMAACLLLVVYLFGMTSSI